MKKRILAGILCLCMFIALPGQACAEISELLTRSAEQNEAALSRLSGLAGGETEAAYALLGELGLLDGSGELKVDERITISGESFTIKQAAELVKKPDVDLTQTVEVDGAAISLGDLKTIIEIESELARIEERYFSEREMSSEQLESLDSLVAAIEGGEVRPLGSGAPTSAADAPLTLDLSALESTALSIVAQTLEADGTFTPRSVTCADCLTIPAGRSVSFKLRVDYGLIPSGDFTCLFDYKLEAFSDSACLNPITSVELPGTNFANRSGAALAINNTGAEALSVTLKLSISKHTGGVSDQLTTLLKHSDEVGGSVSGNITGMLTFYEPSGCYFSSGASGGNDYVYQKSVVITKSYAFRNVYEDTTSYLPWLTGFAYNTGGAISQFMTGTADGSGAMWPLLRKNAGYASADVVYCSSDCERDSTAVSMTAQELYGGNLDDSQFYIEATTTLLHQNMNVDAINKGIAAWGSLLPAPANSLGVRIPFDSYEVYSNGDWRAVTEQDDGRLTLPNPYYDGNPGMSQFMQQAYLGYYNGPTIPIVDYYNYLVAAAEDNKIRVRSYGMPYTLTRWGTSRKITSDSDYITAELNDITGSVTKSFTISVYDETAPTVTSVTAPAGRYVSGQLIPITITFSEPVNTGGLSLQINGEAVYTAAELQMSTTGRKAVAWYEVKDVDSAGLTVHAIAGLTDLSGNRAIHSTAPGTADNDGEGWLLAGVALDSALMRNAVTDITAQYTGGGGATVTVAVKQLDAYKTKYNRDSSGEYDSFKAFITSPSGATAPLALTLVDTGGVLSYTGTASGLILEDTPQTYMVSVRAYESAADTEGACLSEQDALTVPAKVSVTGVRVSSDDPTVTTLKLSETYRPTLTIALDSDAPDDSPATYQTGAWSSSDADIATVITNNGVHTVALTGTKIGAVTLTYTADNVTAATADDVVSNEITYTVEAGLSPALVIPSGSSTIITRQNAATEVLWSSNAALFGAQDIEYTVKVFSGNYADIAALEALTPSWTGSAPKTANSLTLPAGTLGTLSAGMTPAYTVLVSAPHPTVVGLTLKALAHIVVNPVSAKPRLTRPAALSITDDRTAVIGWDIDSFLPSTEARLKIVRVSDESTETVFEDLAVSSASGVYTLDPTEVPSASLKETYIVMLSAKNQGDEIASIDSFTMYVYNGDALSLEYSDGTALPAALPINNDSVVASYTAANQRTDNTSATADLLKLREELGLIEYIGIN